jgi:2',3'-cyclic-nucleotide 2'-phosphodiesterase
MAQTKILMIGDVVGSTGRAMFQKYIPKLKTQYHIDGVIVNGENSAPTGRGITSRIVNFFKHNGANMITSGNHIFAQKEIYAYLENKTDLLRPANFPSDTPGTGTGFFTTAAGVTVGVINIQGRVFMRELLSCPFKTIESLLLFMKTKTPVIIVDIHAETTAEKMGIAHFIDGSVSAVIGTHTHVQTADERILPGGTAFITDVGMVGSLNGMLGMKKEQIIHNFMTQLPVKFVVDVGMPLVLCGVVITIESSTGKAVSIERVKIIDSDVHVVVEDEKER